MFIIIILLSRNAQNIQIGITNHAHLIHSDVENSIYQLFDDCIVDEAHRLPDYALNQVTNELSYADIKYQLGLIGKNENEKLLKSNRSTGKAANFGKIRYCTN